MADSSNDLEKSAITPENNGDANNAHIVAVTPPSRVARLLGWVLNVVPPPKGSPDDAELIPEATAGWFSTLTFAWIGPLLSLGYARPLEASDLYKLQDDRSSAKIAEKITKSFESRRSTAERYNIRLANGEISPGLKGLWWSLRGNRQAREKHWRQVSGRKKASLVLALNDSVFWFFWTGGLIKLFSDTAQITSPLLVKAIINFATDSYTAHRLGAPTPSIGKGIGMAVGLFALQLFASLGQNHFFYRSMTTGVLLRAGLISVIYDKSLRLTARARSTLTNGKLVNHISTDVSRIDFACGYFHMAWTAPIQMIICLILLLINLGPSALAGFGLFIVLTPLQNVLFSKLFTLRQASMTWTDKRAKLLQELLTGIKVIKFFAWEVPYLNRIHGFRDKELAYIRSLVLYRAGVSSLATTLPVLASVVSFIIYGISHQLNPAIIFTSLSLFNLLRMPLIFLPGSISAIADASSATQRIYGVFEAELLDEPEVQDIRITDAIEVKDATFTWDAPPPEIAANNAKTVKREAKEKGSKKMTAPPANHENEKTFQLPVTNLSVPRGQLLAIVGPVGSGKSSLLQGLVGEMRKTSGTVRFGGSVAYCPQVAWIQNATIRDNICFGRPFESEKYWQAVQDSCLQSDLELLPFGDLTEVGERGISLSGGQKQRVNICRAIYCDCDIQIFDDPLSALDAHVGKTVFQEVFQKNPGGRKTRILVTHAIHFLPRVDYIYTMVDGRIAERGTYTELMGNGGEFAKFVTEFGSKENPEEASAAVHKEESIDDRRGVKTYDKGDHIMQIEERNTGGVNKAVYAVYLRATKASIMLPLLVLSLILIQGSTIMSSYWLVYWQERKWPQPQGFYMGVYAGLGVSSTLSSFFGGAMFALMTYSASRTLHRAAITHVMRAPMSFFETTPLGRIMNRFSKDIDTIDNLLGDGYRMLLMTFSNILGTVILIAIILPWFLLAVGAVLLACVWAAIFYQESARELKRLDAILRSTLYAHFSESLAGLATIRAYGESERFKRENSERVDIENRAYFLTVVNQRWLGVRIDLLSILLTFIVAILTVSARFSISPAQTGVTLSYIISVQQSFGWMVRQTAEVQNDMNSVERIVHYAINLEQEPPHEIPDHKPPSPWPAEGRVELKDVILKYRPELPNVLQGLTMAVNPREKIGIVGRTGAGKSSIMTALYRLVELTSGSIWIDGVDISKVGLEDLRSGLSSIPQDAVSSYSIFLVYVTDGRDPPQLLFSGTLRSNLDPFGEHDDAVLWDACRRAYLVENIKPGVIEDGTDGNSTQNRFTLDSQIDEEGSNLSLGQRSLVSLARALVKETRVLILDEATASVDYETDRKIQDTISNEFADRTIICIAHRLRTIIGYDRICVMDSGRIAEFDAPTRLYAISDGIFRGMCDRSSISLEDIRMAAKMTKQTQDY